MKEMLVKTTRHHPLLGRLAKTVGRIQTVTRARWGLGVTGSGIHLLAGLQSGAKTVDASW